MTSRAERSRQRAAWLAGREHQLVEALYLAHSAIGELEANGRWTPATAASITASLDDLARKADVLDAYRRMLQP